MAVHADNGLNNRLFLTSINYNVPMPSEQDKVKRRRPQFPIRTLILGVTLVKLYFGAWELTKYWGIGPVTPKTRKTDLVAPRPFPPCKMRRHRGGKIAPVFYVVEGDLNVATVVPDKVVQAVRRIQLEELPHIVKEHQFARQ